MKNKALFLRRWLLPVVLVMLFIRLLPAQDTSIIMQGFYWNTVPGDYSDAVNGGVWWDTIATVAPSLKNAGFNVVWLPPAQKGFAGIFDMGYGIADYYDYGQFSQYGTTRTRHGNLTQLQNAINTLKTNSIKVMADVVLNHRAGAPTQELEECDSPPPGKELRYTKFMPASGRMAWDSSYFHPNNHHCDLNPPYHDRIFFEDICYFNKLNNILDPALPSNGWYFGPHNLGAAGDSLVLVGRHMIDTMGFDMVRLDAVKHIEPGFMSPFLIELKNASQPFAVGELFDYSAATLRSYQVEVETFTTGSKFAKMAVFDFALRGALRDMCNSTGTYNMANLNTAGLRFYPGPGAPLDAEDIVTFVENHDVDRIGFVQVPCPGGVLQIGSTCLGFATDSGHDPVTADKHMAYAYIMGAQGHPSVFWKDWFWYGLEDEIKWLIALRKATAKGISAQMSFLAPSGGSFTTGDYFIMRRAGITSGVSDGALIGLNDNTTNEQNTFVNTPFSNKYLKDYSDGFMFRTELAAADSRALIRTAKRDFSWWSVTGLYPKPDNVPASHFTMNATPGGCPHFIALKAADAANFLVNGTPIQVGDEIAVKNSAGQVVGIGRIGQKFKWDGVHDMIIEALGSPSSFGMGTGENFRLFVYDASAGMEVEVAAIQFAPSGIAFNFSPDRPNTPNRNGNFATFPISTTAMGAFSCGAISRILAFNTANAQSQPVCGEDQADNTPYNDGWQTGDNGGSNFGAWTLTATGSSAQSGHFRGNSANNGSAPSGNINTGGFALGMYANSGQTASAVRPFVTAMIPGTVFSLKMDNGFINSGGTVGLGLQNSSGNNLLELYFIGGDTQYRYDDSGGVKATGLAFTDGGLIIQITLLTSSTYELAVTRQAGGSFVTTGTLKNPPGGQVISRFRLFNSNAGSGSSNDAFFNSFKICYPPVVINEVDYNQGATDEAEFIELKNMGTLTTNLDNFTVELVNSSGSVYQTIDLPDVSLAPNAYYVICANSANTPNCNLDITPNTNLLQDAAPSGLRVKLGTLTIDALSYDGNTPGATEGIGAAADNGLIPNIGLSRIPDGHDTNQNSTNFKLVCITPGRTNYPSDYGDLTATWPRPCAAAFTDSNNDGIPDGNNGAVWTGMKVDTENSQFLTATADGDDLDNLDDEDGLGLPMTLIRGHPAQFNITLNSNLNGTNMYYGLWFDWDADGTFDAFYNNAVPLVYSGSPVNALVTVTPPGTATTNYKIRLIVSGTGVITNTMVNSAFSNGEVEDYSAPVPLPIELLDFTAEKTANNQVLLRWRTASEKNNAYFSMQRSRDGRIWHEIGQLKGDGTTEKVRDYSFLDERPFEGINYYRFQQFDSDGQFAFSPVRSVQIEKKNIVISLYPNPAQDVVYVKLDGATDKSYHLKVFNALGQQVPLEIPGMIAAQTYEVFVNSWFSGLYIFNFSDENGEIIQIIRFSKK